jgi:hypothetical protein
MQQGTCWANSTHFHCPLVSILLPFWHSSISFPRRISVKDLYEILHFLVRTTSTGNRNFFYYFNNPIIVFLWYSVFHFMYSRFLCWQYICITLDFGFRSDTVELFFFFFSHIAAPRFGTTTHFRYGRYQTTFDVGQYIIEERLTNLNYVWEVTPRGLSENLPT